MEPVEVTHYNKEMGLVLFCTTVGGTETPLQSASLESLKTILYF